MENMNAKPFTARPATLDDVDATAELVNAYYIEQLGKPQCEAQELHTDWQAPTMNMETDLRLVFTSTGGLVGYSGIWDPEPHVKPYSWGVVHPEYKSQGIGAYLAHWIEERARRSIPEAPAGARVVLRQSKPATDTVSQALLRAHGYQLARYFFRMVIEVEDPPPAPALPEGIAIRTFVREQDLRALVSAVREAFRDHWGYVEHPFEQEYQEWAHWIDNDPHHDPSVWFLALDGEQIVGASLCLPKMTEDPDMGYVDTLGVRRSWRRQGIALALLHHSFGEFYRRGKRRVSLDVDAESLTGATRLYEKAGMHVQRQSAGYEKELRPGKDLSTQSVQ